MVFTTYTSWLRLRELFEDAPERALQIFRRLTRIIGKRRGIPLERLEPTLRLPKESAIEIVDDTIKSLRRGLLASITRGEKKIIIEGRRLQTVWNKLPKKWRRPETIRTALEMISKSGKAFVDERGTYILEKNINGEYLRLFLDKRAPGKFELLDRIGVDTTPLELGRQPWIKQEIAW